MIGDSFVTEILKTSNKEYRLNKEFIDDYDVASAYE